MSVKERLLEFIRYKNISVKRFEEKCGLSNGYISSMRKGLGVEKLENVLKQFPDLNRDWLLYGEKEMLVNNISGTNYGSIGENVRTTYNGSIGSTINVAMPESGYQKIIRPDGTTELIKSDSTLNENPNYINELRDQVRTLSSQVESLTILLEEKERLIKSKEETICILRNLHHKNQD